MSFACNWCWRPGYAHEGIIITSRKSTIWSFPSRHSIKSNYKCHYKGIDNDTLKKKKNPCRYYPVTNSFCLHCESRDPLRPPGTRKLLPKGKCIYMKWTRSSSKRKTALRKCIYCIQHFKSLLRALVLHGE